MSNDPKLQKVIDDGMLHAIGSVNKIRKRKIQVDEIDGLMLYGDNGAFDSMGLVTFLNIVEESFLELFGAEMQLMSEKAMSEKVSPFLSIKSLKSFIRKEIKLEEGVA